MCPHLCSWHVLHVHKVFLVYRTSILCPHTKELAGLFPAQVPALPFSTVVRTLSWGPTASSKVIYMCISLNGHNVTAAEIYETYTVCGKDENLILPSPPLYGLCHEWRTMTKTSADQLLFFPWPWSCHVTWRVGCKPSIPFYCFKPMFLELCTCWKHRLEPTYNLCSLLAQFSAAYLR